MEKKVSEELDCLTKAFEKSKLSKLVALKKNNFSEDYPNGSSKNAIGNAHFTLTLNGLAQRDYGLLKLAYHVDPKAMDETGCHGLYHHLKQHKSAKIIRDGDNTVAHDGNWNTYFEVDPENVEEDLCKGFNELARKLKLLGATQTNLCSTCTKEEKGCVVNPSGPVSSCSLHDPKA